MAGTFTGKVGASGTVPSPAATLYTVPALTVAYIKKMVFVNRSQYEQDLIVFKRADGSNDREIGRSSLLAGERFEIEGTIAEAGDLIRAEATDPSAIDYTIDVVEET